MWISLIVIISSLLSFILCIIYNNALTTEYEYVWLLPVVFLFTYFFMYNALLKSKNMRITSYVVLCYSWLRCVLTPLIGSISGYYTTLGVMATSQSTQSAIIIMAYEQIIISVLLAIYSFRKKGIKRFEKKISLEGNKKVYFLYFFIALFVFLIFGRDLDLFQFMLISADDTVRRGDITNTSTLIIRQIISSGMLFLFLLLVETFRKAYDRTEKNTYINFALIAAILLVGMIVGERRSSQIYLAFASAWLLIRIFPLKRKKIILTISLTALLVILMMSIYKFFYVFSYGSYTQAIAGAEINFNWVASVLDAYFFGVRVVSSNIGFGDIAQIDFVNMIYGFARSFFGLSFLLKDNTTTISELYNLLIYRGAQSSGHLFSSIGYGYAYVGFIFAPVITCFNLYIALKLEEWFRNSKSIEMNFIISFVFMRFAFGMFSNPEPLINSTSRYLIINGLIFLGAWLLNSNKNGRVIKIR
jgi:hypothetical protein